MHEIVISGERMCLVRDMGKTVADQRWIHPDRVIDYNVLIFGLTGCMEVVEDGREYFLHPGEVMFLKAGVHHWGHPRTTPGASNYYIHFFDPPAGSSAGKGEYRFFPDQPSFAREDHNYSMTIPKQIGIKDVDGFQLKVESLFKQYREGEFAKQLYLDLGLTELLCDIYRQSRIDYQPRQHPAVRRAIKYLETHYAQPLDTEALSRKLKLNYNYLSGLFSKSVGMSIKAYLLRLRIHRAARLLKTTSCNITEASEAAGFNDPLYFSRAFRKILGESPSEYLKSIYR